MKGMSSAPNSPNFRKKVKKFKRAREVMKIGRSGLGGQLMKSNDIIDALSTPAKDHMVPKDLSTNI